MGMKGVYLLLGSNLGDSESILRLAKSLIEARIGTVIKASSIYLTKAWGIENQPDFLNQVLELDTVLDASKVLQYILEIERELGRIRFQKWGTRIIDIDILYFGKLIIDTKNLVIPHPENQNRNFVLVPMAEIAPDLMHPVLQLSQTELLKKCPDKMKVALLQK
jgi:2-amino-4-hydroxy-6-hydroxymethyldihydropteridine diphosphokinase